MAQIIKAVYDNGVFKRRKSVQLRELQRVKLTVQSISDRWSEAPEQVLQ